MKLIESLYAGEKKIEVKFIGKDLFYSIELTKQEFKGGEIMNYVQTADCRITSWIDNVWFRTPKGVNYEKYKSVGSLKQAITLSARSRGFEVEEFEVI